MTRHPRIPTVSVRRRSSTRRRRGFNLIELLIALSITAALMTATMVALDASFRAYQSTAEAASTHTISRLAMHRMLVLIRTGDSFGPYPTSPIESTIESDVIEFETPNGQLVSIEWDEIEEAIYLAVFQYNEHDEQWNQVSYDMLLAGVVPQFNEENERIKPFTLEYDQGTQLHRATIDMKVLPDSSMQVDLDGDNTETIRLIASAMPRSIAY